MIVKRVILGFILLVSIDSYAQKLTKCSECNTKKYNNANISTNELFELELLRNEIFARHQYIFENRSLEEYFQRFDWYKPDYKNKTAINLNTIEQHNVALFKKREKELKQQRVTLINELKIFKKALNNNDQAHIEKVLLARLKKSDTPYYNELISKLKNTLSKIPLDAINWHKGNAQYSIEIDNGFSVSSEGIYIKRNEISIIISDPQEHSSLMKDDAFEYPSTYDSESENTFFIEFKIEHKKLVLVKTKVAG